MNDRTIWLEAQNKPSLIADDLAPLVEAGVVYEVLLRRGVFKWFAVRRDLIRSKNLWKARVTESIARQKEYGRAGDGYRVAYERGYRRALEECRAEVREMCHSERWRVQDNDRRAKRWLARRGGQERAVDDNTLTAMAWSDVKGAHSSLAGWVSHSMTDWSATASHRDGNTLHREVAR